MNVLMIGVFVLGIGALTGFLWVAAQLSDLFDKSDEKQPSGRDVVLVFMVSMLLTAIAIWAWRFTAALEAAAEAFDQAGF